MSENYGWAGKYLYIDLTSKKIKKIPLSQNLKDNYLGGRGINMKFLYDYLKPGLDPLSLEVPLIIGTGPLTGTVAGTGRYNVTTKSPMTGILSDGNSGGHWAPELKYAGYDHIIITGKSEKPVYIWIYNEQVEILDASSLWGKNVWLTTEMIHRMHNDLEIQVAAIGQAGENLVKYSCMINGLSRAAARCGSGAVMGSKKLKAIAVRGTKGVKIAHPDKLLNILREMFQKTTESPRFEYYPRYGTPALVNSSYPVGRFPVKNFSSSILPGIEKIDGKAFLEKYVEKSKACFGCYVHCDHFYHVREGDFAGTKGPGLEYETIGAFGGRCANTNLPSILKANNLCNQYGIDVISTGTSISLAIDLFERGIITEKDTDGLVLRWGDEKLIIELIHKIAKREGFGNLLAEGPYLMAKIIGRGAEKRVMHIKKLDPDGGENRCFKGACLSYAVSTRGAEHLRGLIRTELSGFIGKEEAIKKFGSKDIVDPDSYDTVGKPKAVIWYEHLSLVTDCLQICKFNTIWAGFPIHLKELTDLFNAVTGVRIEKEEAFSIAERVYNLEKAINIREGQKKEDDMPSERHLIEPMSDGPGKGALIEKDKFQSMLDAYYKLRGWDVNTSFPTREKLLSLELKNVADDLRKMGKIK